MAKRRKVTPVTLTPEQREKLERLWFYYGNYGPKTTPGNHSFIQRLLENGIDERSLYNKRTPKSEIPTPEYERAVEAILSMKTKLESPNERIRISGLRIVSSVEDRSQPTNVDPEMKAILEDMKRRNRMMHKRLESQSDTPDAA
jgi:vesicle coat complex subunit